MSKGKTREPSPAQALCSFSPYRHNADPASASTSASDSSSSWWQMASGSREYDPRRDDPWSMTETDGEMAVVLETKEGEGVSGNRPGLGDPVEAGVRVRENSSSSVSTMLSRFVYDRVYCLSLGEVSTDSDMAGLHVNGWSSCLEIVCCWCQRSASV